MISACDLSQLNEAPLAQVVSLDWYGRRIFECRDLLHSPGRGVLYWRSLVTPITTNVR